MWSYPVSEQGTKEMRDIDLGAQLAKVSQDALALIEYLQKDRDEWKAKCTEAQQLAMRQAYKIRTLERQWEEAFNR